jgi:Flp pilus assembly protein TadD
MSATSDIHTREGIAARARGDFASAERAFRAAVKADPRDAAARRELALTLTVTGDRDVAVTEMRRAVSARPTHAPWHLDLAELLDRVGDAEGAYESYRRAAALDPATAKFAGRVAAHAWRLRKREEAITWAQRALAIDPDDEMARLTVARASIAAKDHAAATQVLDRLAQDSRLKSARIQALHLIGTIREAQEQWGEAFDAFQASNELALTTPAAKQALGVPLGAMLPHDLGPRAREFYASWAQRRFDDGIPAPVILTGFPRSGTTLVEQVLTAHPRICSAEELPVTLNANRRLFPILQAMASGTHLERLDALTDPQIRELRRLWWEALRDGVPPAQRRRLIVDKHPLRVMELGLVNRLFPEARIVVMIRDPRDVCTSALLQSIEINPAMVRFLDQRLCAQWYTTVMGHWLAMREVTSLSWMELRYEDLVEDFRPRVSAMLEFIGEPWDDAVERFHDHAAGRIVRSASADQVTQKLHTRSVGRWKRYGDRIGPMLDLLRPMVERLGYPAE